MELFYSLAHQRIVRADIPDNSGGNVFRLAIRVSAKDDSTLGIIQQSLDPVKVCVIWDTSDDPRFFRAVWIEFLISGNSALRSTFEGSNGKFAYTSLRAVMSASSPSLGIKT